MMKKVIPQTKQNNSSELQKALSYSLSLISIRLRTEKEIKTKLTDKKYSEEIIMLILDKLKTANLINDKNFASLWADSRKHFKNKSNLVIKQELKEKGISTEIIQELFEKDDELTDEKAAEAMLERKSYLFSKKTGRDRILKKQQYLARNGFSWDTIKKVTRENE